MPDQVLLPVNEDALRQFLTGELQREMRAELGVFGDAQRQTINNINDTLTNLKARCSETTTKIDKDLDDLKEKANKRLTQVIVPVAAVFLILGICGVWVLVGGLAMQLRKETNDALIELTTRKKELADMGSTLDAMKEQLKDMKAGTTVVARIDGHLKKTDEDLGRLTGRVVKMEEFRETQLKKAAQASSAP